MPSSAVCSITDPLESIKACVDASLAKMDAANGQTQRARRPQSAKLAPPPPPLHRHPPPSRPSTARSPGPAAPLHSRSANPGPPQAPGAATTASRDLLAYARQRFENVVAVEDHEENENGRLGSADSPSGFSAASHQSHLTSKTLVSAYVTLTSSSTASGRFAATATTLPALRPAQKQQHELRLRLLNEIRVRAKKQPVRMQHDRVAQELCQEGGLPSHTAVYPYSWPDAFRWRVEPQPRFERERRAAQEQMEKRLAAAADLLEPEPEEKKEEEKEKEPTPPEGKSKRRPRGPPSVSSVGSTEKRKVQSAVRRVEREVGKLKAEAKRRAEAEAEAEAARLAEEEAAAAAAEAGESGPLENAEEATVEKVESLPASGLEDDLGAKNETDEDDEPEPCPEEVPDFLCPSSEEKSRQHEVRLWLRKTTYSNAPDFLPIY